MPEVKTIGVLTSGGDAPGMNAAIRAVVRTGIYYGFRVMGIRRGYNGLIEGDIFEMNLRSVSDIIQRGGTILLTARSPEFMTENGLKKAASMCKIFKIDALVVIGGDGSFRGARDLSKFGINVVGIPGTIDNDIACTDYTIGFDTALNTVQDAINKIRDTATSHERVSILEVMGRHAGYIALYSGIAGGAESIVIPEKGLDKDEIIRRIIDGKNKGKLHNLIILAEGIGGATELAKEIEEATGIETRATILGYIQRGGSPTAYDRVMASLMGAKAVEVIREGKKNRIIAMKDGKIVDYDIDEALSMQKSIDEYMYNLATILSL